MLFALAILIISLKLYIVGTSQLPKYSQTGRNLIVFLIIFKTLITLVFFVAGMFERSLHEPS